MKRLINGVRMLEDLESKKITLLEKMTYLVVIIGPELLFLNNSESDKNSVKDNVYVNFGIFILSVGIFYFIVKRIQGEPKAIERYICLAVPAIVTSYIFLIPLSLLLEALLRKQVTNENLDMFFSYFLAFYMPLYVPASLFLWKKRNGIR